MCFVRYGKRRCTTICVLPLKEQGSRSNYSIRALNDILNLAETIPLIEVEKNKTEGGIIFYNNTNFENEHSNFIKKFDLEQPIKINDIAKVRKYLDVSDGSSTFLIFQQESLLGLVSTTDDNILEQALNIRFFKNGKVSIFYGNSYIFDISNRTYKQFYNKFTWHIVNEYIRNFLTKGFLSGITDETCLKYSEIIFHILQACRKKGKGSILVIGDTEKYLNSDELSNKIKIEPVPIYSTNEYNDFLSSLELIPALDGATFFDKQMNLVAFSAILPSVTLNKNEDKQHGARHNSALRFSNDKKDIFIIVLSEDGPLSTIYNGEYLNDPNKI